MATPAVGAAALPDLVLEAAAEEEEEEEETRAGGGGRGPRRGSS